MADRMDDVGVADRKAPVIQPGYTSGTVTDKISAIVLERPASTGWFVGFGIGFMLTMMMLFAIGYLVVKGTGIWASTSRSDGASPSSTSCGGSASATPAH